MSRKRSRQVPTWELPALAQASSSLHPLKGVSSGEDCYEGYTGLGVRSVAPECLPHSAVEGQSQQEPSAGPTFRVTSHLVFLDITVLDKKGHPVVTGLTKDDFIITEDKKTQRISSFEPPEIHVANAGAANESATGDAPMRRILDRRTRA